MKSLNSIKRTITLILILIFLFSNISYAYNEEIGIENGVSAYLLGDFDSGVILEDYNIETPVEVASITKLMTYLIVMEEIDKGNVSLDDLVYINKEIEEVKGSSFNLKAGEVLTVKELLDAMIIISANDASLALAKHTAGNEEHFVSIMNKKAKQLGLKNTLYLNCTGLPEKGIQNRMSTADIFILSKYIIKKYPQILSISSTPCLEIEERQFKKENTNPLLKEIEGVDGLKTGYTDKAGYCLVSSVNVGDKSSKESNFKLIGIVMGTSSEKERKKLSKALIDYGINNYSKENVMFKDEPIDSIEVFNGRKGKIEVYPKKDVKLLTKKGENIYKDITIYEKVKAPLKKGDKVGSATILNDSGVVEEVPLVVREDLKRANPFTMANRYLKNFLLFIKAFF